MCVYQQVVLGRKTAKGAKTSAQCAIFDSTHASVSHRLLLRANCRFVSLPHDCARIFIAMRGYVVSAPCEAL
jgi:hypothetical protein